MQPHYNYKFLSLNSVDQNVGLVLEPSNPGSATHYLHDYMVDGIPMPHCIRLGNEHQPRAVGKVM